MGASLVVRTHDHCSRSDLQKWVNKVQESVAFEEGHSYSGEWNMCSGNLDFSFSEQKVFASADEAEEFIADHHEKWEPLLAVKAYSSQDMPPKAQSDKLLSDLLKKANDLNLQIAGMSGAVLARVKSGKSKLKACDHCDSRISVSHLHSTRCPVCRTEFLFTETDTKRLQALEVKSKEAKAKYEARLHQILASKPKGQTDRGIVWLVGGWCAS